MRRFPSRTRLHKSQSNPDMNQGRGPTRGTRTSKCGPSQQRWSLQFKEVKIVDLCHRLWSRRNDPGVPSIECTINGYSFQKTVYDTGSDVNIMAAVTYQLLHKTMPLQPTYIQLQMIWRLLTWEKTNTIHPSSLGDCSSAPLKQSSTLEPEKSTCTSPLRRRRNRNQRRQIIKDRWADYEGEVVMSEDIQLEQNCAEETIAPSQVCREKIVIHEDQAPPEPPTTPSSESQDEWENEESRWEDLKTQNALPRGKLGSYLFL